MGRLWPDVSETYETFQVHCDGHNTCYVTSLNASMPRQDICSSCVSTLTKGLNSALTVWLESAVPLKSAVTTL